MPPLQDQVRQSLATSQSKAETPRSSPRAKAVIACNAAGCNNKGRKDCGRCKLVRYCGRECQVNDWVNHRHVCKEVKTPRSKDRLQGVGKNIRDQSGITQPKPMSARELQDKCLAENPTRDYVIIGGGDTPKTSRVVYFDDPGCKIMFKDMRARAIQDQKYVRFMYDILLSKTNLTGRQQDILRAQLRSEYGVDPLTSAAKDDISVGGPMEQWIQSKAAEDVKVGQDSMPVQPLNFPKMDGQCSPVSSSVASRSSADSRETSESRDRFLDSREDEPETPNQKARQGHVRRDSDSMASTDFKYQERREPSASSLDDSNFVETIEDGDDQSCATVETSFSKPFDVLRAQRRTHLRGQHSPQGSIDSKAKSDLIYSQLQQAMDAESDAAEKRKHTKATPAKLKQDKCLEANPGYDYVIFGAGDRERSNQIIDFKLPSIKAIFKTKRDGAMYNKNDVIKMYSLLILSPSMANNRKRKILRLQLLAEYGVDPVDSDSSLANEMKIPDAAARSKLRAGVDEVKYWEMAAVLVMVIILSQ